MSVSNLQSLMTDLFLDGKYSDLTISCQGVDFRVHRAIVCSQSRYFDVAANGNFKEAVTARIDLPEDDLATVRCILSYLYFQDYSPGDQIAFWQTLRASVKSDMKPASSQTKVETEAQAYSHLKVYEAAGKYLIEPLRLLAKDRFISWVKANVLHGSLSGVFRQVLDSPMAHDLHGEITQILSENIVYCLNQDKMVETLEDYPKIAIAVLRNVATARAQLLERISRRPIH